MATSKREKLAREMTHYSPSDDLITAYEGAINAPSGEDIRKAIDVGMGRMGREVAYGEKPLAGGLDIAEVGGIPINATDFIGTGIPSKIAMGAKAFAPAIAAALGGTAIASKASEGAKLNALANVLRKERGIFAGVNAKTADLEALARARELKAAGVPDAEIWPQTGWALDTPDRMPRFEIPDDAAKASYGALDWAAKNPQAMPKISNVVKHRQLYDAYPDVSEIPLFTHKGSGASFSDIRQGGSPSIKLSSFDEPRSPAIHELQHAIQQREGFARGGSPETSAGVGMTKDNTMDFARKAYEQSHQTSGDPLLEELLGGAKKWEELTPREQLGWIDQGRMMAYRNLAGEAEARLTQSRMNMTPEQRLAQYPYEPEYFRGATGVNLDDLIVRNDGGVAMSAQNNINNYISRLYELNTPITRDESRELVRGAAEEFAQKYIDAGGMVDRIEHSGSGFGPSSYIYTHEFADPFRISNHSKGVFNNQFVNNIFDEDSVKKYIDILQEQKSKQKAFRESPEGIAYEKQQKQLLKEHEEKLLNHRLKSADKKLAKGKVLTISEQEAVDWRNAQRNSANILAGGAAGAVGLNALSPYLQENTD